MSETVELPTEVVADHARQQALLDSDPDVFAPEGAEIDVWNIINEAEVRDVAWEDGDLHVWYEAETTIEEKVSRASRLEPAEYRNHYCRTHVSIVWGFDPEESPAVTIEVETP